MAPKKPPKQKAITTPAYVSEIVKTIDRLCETIDTQRDNGRMIDTSEVLDDVTNRFSAYRKKRKDISREMILQLVNAIDDRGDKICNRLDPAAIALILEMTLTANCSCIPEILVFMLANTLSEKANFDNDFVRFHQWRKDIGERVFLNLLNHLFDTGNPFKMRRWTGNFAIQLCSLCSNDLDLWGNIPDQTRRSLGVAMLEEENELIRVLLGVMIRDLSKAGIDMAAMFPEKTEAALLASFPVSSQMPHQWNKKFEDFLSRSESVVKPGERIFFGNFATLLPKCNLGDTSSVYLWISETALVVMVQVETGSTFRFLDIPIILIHQMNVIRNPNNERIFITIETQSQQDLACVLDTASIEMHRLYFSMHDNEDVEDFTSNLRATCQNLEVGDILDQGGSLEDSLRAELSESQRQNQVLISQESIILNPPDGRSPYVQQRSDNHDENDFLDEKLQFMPSNVDVDNSTVRFETKITNTAQTTKAYKDLINESQEAGTEDQSETGDNGSHRSDGIGESSESHESVPSNQDSTPAEEQKKNLNDFKASKMNDQSIQVDEVQAINATKGGSHQNAANLTQSKTMDQTAIGSTTDNHSFQDDSTKIGSMKRPRIVPKAKAPIKMAFTKTSPPTNSIKDSQAPLLKWESQQGRHMPKSFGHKQSITRTATKEVDNTCSRSSDVFDLPNDDDVQPVKVRFSSKSKSKTRNSTGSQIKKARTTKGGSKIKRKSAPAAIQRASPTRQSQRIAALASTQTQTTNSSKVESQTSKKDFPPTKLEFQKQMVQRQSRRSQNSDADSGNEQKSPGRRRNQDIQTRPGGRTNKIKHTYSRSKVILSKKFVNDEDEEAIDTVETSREVVAIELQKGVTRSIECEEKADTTNTVVVNEVDSTAISSQHRAKPIDDNLKDFEDEDEDNFPLMPDEITAEIVHTHDETLAQPAEVSDGFISKGVAKESPLRVSSQRVDEMSKRVEHQSQSPSSRKSLSPVEAVRGDDESESYNLDRPYGDNGQLLEASTARLNAFTADENVQENDNVRNITSNSKSPTICFANDLDRMLTSGKIGIQVLSSEKQRICAIPSNDLVSEPSQPVKKSDGAPNNLDRASGEVIAKETIEGLQDLATTVENNRSVTAELSDGKNTAHLHKSPKSATKISESMPTATTKKIAEDNRTGYQKSLPNFQRSVQRESTRKRHVGTTVDTDVPHHAKDDFQRTTDMPLIDEHLFRKQTIISFNEQGAQNQGGQIAGRNLFSKFLRDGQGSPQQSGIAFDTPIHPLKRKFDQRSKVSSNISNNPPSKRQNSATKIPRELEDNGYMACQDSSSQCSRNSSLQGERQIADEEHIRLLKRNLGPQKQSSQTSRVDFNGSPHAKPVAQLIDYIGHLERSMSADIELERQKIKGDSTVPTNHWQETRSKVPGLPLRPRNRLKAKLRVPGASESHFIAHVAEKHGQYRRINSNEVVKEVDKLEDMFPEKATKITPFLQQIQGRDNPQPPSFPEHIKVNHIKTLDNSTMKQPSIYRPASTEHTSAQPDIGESHLRKPFVPEHTANKRISPNPRSTDNRGDYVNEISSSPTTESSRSNSTNTNTNKSNEDRVLWNTALRPHYTKLYDIVHRIANDVIIHLSNEEDNLDLLVQDYEVKGAKIIHDYNRTRAVETGQIQRELNIRGKQIAKVYREMGRFIALTPSRTSVSDFENSWRKKQAQVRESISTFSSRT